MLRNDTMMPPYLYPKDEIRIVSPSGAIDPKFIDGASLVLSTWGYKVSEGKFARAVYGRFAGNVEQRISDLQEALNDESVKAIVCSRGGYGLAQIVDSLDFSIFAKSPKWLIGFSDITILHNAISKLNIASIHGIMAKHLSELPADDDSVKFLKNILAGDLPEYKVPTHALNRVGDSQAILIGGNLSVFMGLRGSQYDFDYNNKILFIEDIAEEPYHIDRMMQNLRFSGALDQLSGLIVGQFSDCSEDPQMKQTISDIIFNAVKDYNYPVCFNFPVGHVDYNLPVINGAEVRFIVTEESVILKF